MKTGAWLQKELMYFLYHTVKSAIIILKKGQIHYNILKSERNWSQIFHCAKIVEKEDREPTNTDDDIDEKNVELFDSFDIESLPLDIMKRENPWDISSIYDLAYFCCPECDYKHQDKQDFVSHASSDHPWVSLEHM